MKLVLRSPLPPEVRTMFEALTREPLRPTAELRADVERYLRAYEAAGARNEFLDLGLARDLAARSGRLLDALPGLDDGDQRLVQAAVRYFVIVADGDDDHGIGGLDDDALVIAAVEAHLGLGAPAGGDRP